MWWIVKQVKLARRVWTYRGDARGWALGVALGVLLGLVPKGNMTALAVSLVFFSLRTNFSLGLATATIVSLFAPVLDPLTHAIGTALLGSEWLRPVWLRLHRLPIVPWLHWNNTVVLGSLIVGLAAVYPVYHVAFAIGQLFEKTQRRPVALLPAPAQHVELGDVEPPVLVLPPAQAPPRHASMRSPWRGDRVA